MLFRNDPLKFYNVENNENEKYERIEKKIDKLNDMVTSLAKELGYTWESEAVKEKDYSNAKFPSFLSIESIKKLEFMLPEKAVLKWGWKKIHKK